MFQVLAGGGGGGFLMWGEREREKERERDEDRGLPPNPAAPSIPQARNSKPLPPPIAELNSKEASHSFQAGVYAVSSV